MRALGRSERRSPQIVSTVYRSIAIDLIPTPDIETDAGYFMGVRNVRSDPSPRRVENYRRWYKHMKFHDLTNTAASNSSRFNIRVN
ncbi:hypothetical protein TNCV_2640381 [Trichonephila clavipes]|nr:hypothetical protein TNCV_2640381 [Trichonephila clavipes]